MKSIQRGARILGFLFVLHAMADGASHSPKNGDGQRTHTVMRTKIKIYDALKIAVDVLQAKQLMYRADYKLHASRVGNEWVFWFVFLPETPGLDITVFVSDEGQTRLLPGF